VTGQLERAERDHRADELAGAAYTRLLASIEPELEGARAEHARLSRKADEVRDAALALDVEEEALRRLAELRVAVAGRVSAAAETGDIAALRAAISAVFERVVTARRDTRSWRSTGTAIAASGTRSPSSVPGSRVGGEFYLEPHLSREMIANWDADGSNGLRVPERVPLKLEINPTTSGVPE
jgi:hypothetical protein